LRKPLAAQLKRWRWRILTPIAIKLPSHLSLLALHPRTCEFAIPQAARRNRSAYVPLGRRFLVNSQDRASDGGQSGDRDRAIADFTKAIEINPKYAKA